MPEVTDLDDLHETPHAEVFEEQRPRVVRLRLDAGQRIPPHRHPGTDVVFHLVRGRLGLTVDGDRYDLVAGDLIRFSGDRQVSPRAVDDSVAIVVFAPDQ